MISLLKKLNETKPFGVCKKCGFYVTNLKNVRAFRHVYIEHYVCNFCGPISKEDIDFGAKRKGNLPRKENLKVKAEKRHVDKYEDYINYELNFPKEINEMLDLAIITGKMLDFKVEVLVYDGLEFLLVEKNQVGYHDDVESLLIIFEMEGQSSPRHFIAITYERDFKIRKFHISGSEENSNLEGFKNEFDKFYESLTEVNNV